MGAKKLLKRILYRLPAHLERNQKENTVDRLYRVRESLVTHYHRGWRSRESYSAQAYEDDLHAHVEGRLADNRNIVIPWIDRAMTIRGKRILEIGCGTGSSTVALAEQGAALTGIDLDEGALKVAQTRARVYGVDCQFHLMNASELAHEYGPGSFDAIIFFACLEHMTIDERLPSLRWAWGSLPAGGILVIVETPNRLWYFDEHTSRIPFFNWLPDSLAFDYARFSDRENFRELYSIRTPETELHFLRRGRGVSFHELDLAIDPDCKRRVVSSLAGHRGRLHRLTRPRLQQQYKTIMQRIYPGIHSGFFEAYLDIILRKQ